MFFIQIFSVCINILTNLNLKFTNFFSIFLYEKTIVVTLKTFEQILPQKVVCKFHNHTESILLRCLWHER
jgi:hypothetical protein